MIPIPFPQDPGLTPEIPLYTCQQYSEDLIHRGLISPGSRGHNKIRCSYNTKPFTVLRNGNARYHHPTPQDPTKPGVMDKRSIPVFFRGWMNNVPERFNPFYQYYHLELVKMHMDTVYMDARFDRWVVQPMVTVRFANLQFNTDGNLCHHYKQPTSWFHACHWAERNCSEGNECRFAHNNQELDIAERTLRNWGHRFPHEAGALIKVYREAQRVVNAINPNPQQLSTPIRCRPDQVWLSETFIIQPAAEPIHQEPPPEIVPRGALHRAIPAVPPMALMHLSPAPAFPKDIDMPAPAHAAVEII